MSVVKIVESGELSAEADADNKTQSPIIQFKHLQNNSCLLKEARVRQVIETGTNEFMITIKYSSELLILKDFKVCAKIIDHIPTNIKGHMQLVAHYDKNSFPFVICEGSDSISLVNTRTQSMQQLLLVPHTKSGICVSQAGREFEYHFL